MLSDGNGPCQKDTVYIDAQVQTPTTLSRESVSSHIQRPVRKHTVKIHKVTESLGQKSSFGYARTIACQRRLCEKCMKGLVVVVVVSEFVLRAGPLLGPS